MFKRIYLLTEVGRRDRHEALLLYGLKEQPVGHGDEFLIHLILLQGRLVVEAGQFQGALVEVRRDVKLTICETFAADGVTFLAHADLLERVVFDHISDKMRHACFLVGMLSAVVLNYIVDELIQLAYKAW